ncbi:hypothetical protein QJS10_CPA01g01464 [Acorus calamus]|uniref:Pectinesterase inhibitor domain-containing protein n=1 Tax=Acorus calamus TaxID=4465 RepID=A0AAV9FGM4_ACOCL|nr:hypothetical protein QJS10_CPA01g01464 [Acorus calamus]
MENHPLSTLAIPLTLFMSILLAILTNTTSQQLCIPQFELANEACNIFAHTPSSSSHPVIPQDDNDDHDHGSWRACRGSSQRAATQSLLCLIRDAMSPTHALVSLREEVNRVREV